MSNTATKDRVPEHLVGTRAALFHVLRGASIAPAEDPMARAEMHDPATLGAPGQLPDAAHNSPVFLKSARDRFTALMREDEFHFNF